MTDETQRQRLAAILAADAAGYSRLMATDESGTVAALDAARAVFRAQIEANQGRVVDTAGDSVLAVFETAAGAVRVALAVQKALAAASSAVPDDRRMRFRIGVHLGDVIEKTDGTVYGDGVNIAARLQGIAEPGGITLSESIRSAVKGKVSAEFDDLGEQKVKNIAEPVRAYRVKPGANEATLPKHSVAKMALSVPDRPSIAVLPFTNMSGDPEQEYFADGMVEDIITELSRFESLFVIARNTTFTYKGQSVDVRKVAAELGVHFVLEGSVRKAGDRVRVNAQLIDGETGRHIWAERYDEGLSDVFEVQERITRKVVSAMSSEIELEEIRRTTGGRGHFGKAEDLAWQAWKCVDDAMFGGTVADTEKGLALAERALAVNANCWRALITVASGNVWNVFMSWTQNRDAAISAARRAADAVVRLAPNDGASLFTRGIAGIVSGEFSTGISDLRRAHALNPNYAITLFVLSQAEASEGNVEEARRLAEQAIRMSPKDRWLGTAHLATCMCAYLEGDMIAARDYAALAIQNQPGQPLRRAMVIGCAAELGDRALARTHLEALHRMAPGFIPALFRGDYHPFRKPEHMAKLLASLRKAGLGA